MPLQKTQRQMRFSEEKKKKKKKRQKRHCNSVQKSEVDYTF